MTDVTAVEDTARDVFVAGVRVRFARFKELAKKLLRNPTTVFGLVLIVVLVGMAVFAPFIVEPNPIDPTQMPRDWGAIHAPPGSPGHPLGANGQGGDMLYGMVWGARPSLRLSVTVVTVTVVIGVLVGSLSMLIGERWGERAMRVADVFLSFPELIFALAIAAVLGASFVGIIVALSLVMWPKYARIVRSQILYVKESEYVKAARAMGDSKLRIYLRDVLPNSITPVVVQATLEMGNVVLMGATLSFIGLAEVGLAEWGVLVSQGLDGISTGNWWASFFPGMMVFLWAMGFNLLGDGLRDVLDPRLEPR